MLVLTIVAMRFDAVRCRRKCGSLFGDSPSKKELCLTTCSSGFYQRDKVQFGQKQMKKQVTTCLAMCNQEVNSSTAFHQWSKCRRSCVTDDRTGAPEFFQAGECKSECNRYWMDTVYWIACQAQCAAIAAPATRTPPPAHRTIARYDGW
jgi:hypothetical protein